MVQPVVRQIIDKGYVTKGYLGVHVVDRTNSYEEEFIVQLGFDSTGVVVFDVPAHPPAYIAGLRCDDIITHINNHPVGSVPQVAKLLAAMDKSETAELTVWRFQEGLPDGRRIRIDVPEAAASGWRAVEFAHLKDTVSNKLDALQAPEAGVRVTRVDVDGPASAAGLRRDDLIMRVNDEPVSTVRQLQSVVSSIMPGEIARLSVWRFDRSPGTGTALTIPVSLTRLNELTLGLLPADQDREAIPALGIARMSTCTAETAQRFGIRHQPGVLLEELVANTSLGRRTVPGSIIVQVNDEPVTDIDDFLTLLRKRDLTFGVYVDVLLPDGSMQRVRLVVP
jgi:S1-C subfamily serine protease